MRLFNISLITLALSGAVLADDSLSSAESLVKSGALAKAKPLLQRYLAEHPRDPRAAALLGVVDTRLGDNAGGAAAFRQAGSVPEHFKPVAVQAYTAVAMKAMHDGDNPKVVESASWALALQPGYYAYYLRGTAYTRLEKFSEGLADLEQAHALGSSGRAEASIADAVDAELVEAYLRDGRTERALALASELRQRSPASDWADRSVADYYNRQAEKHSHEGRLDLTAADLETAARAVPSQAAALYVQAANALTGVHNVDWKRIKADADLALAADHNNARASYIGGVAACRLGDKEAGVALLRQAKSLAVGDAALLKEIASALLVLDK